MVSILLTGFTRMEDRGGGAAVTQQSRGIQSNPNCYVSEQCYNVTIVMYLNNSQPKSSLLNMHAFIYEHYLFYLLCICTKTNKQIAPQNANTTVVSAIVYVFCVNLKRQNQKSLLFFTKQGENIAKQRSLMKQL